MAELLERGLILFAAARGQHAGEVTERGDLGAQPLAEGFARCGTA